MARSFWQHCMAVCLVAEVGALGLLGACRPAPDAESSAQAGGGTAGRRVGACSAGRAVDSAYVVRVATEVFSAHGEAANLRTLSYEAVRAPGPIEEGILVRLVPRGSRQMGGGGLVFVELESGCAVPLKLYE
jgi:hypothetical protein